MTCEKIPHSCARCGAPLKHFKKEYVLDGQVFHVRAAERTCYCQGLIRFLYVEKGS